MFFFSWTKNREDKVSAQLPLPLTLTLKLVIILPESVWSLLVFNSEVMIGYKNEGLHRRRWRRLCMCVEDERERERMAMIMMREEEADPRPLSCPSDWLLYLLFRGKEAELVSVYDGRHLSIGHHLHVYDAWRGKTLVAADGSFWVRSWRKRNREEWVRKRERGRFHSSSWMWIMAIMVITTHRLWWCRRRKKESSPQTHENNERMQREEQTLMNRSSNINIIRRCKGRENEGKATTTWMNGWSEGKKKKKGWEQR